MAMFVTQDPAGDRQGFPKQALRFSITMLFHVIPAQSVHAYEGILMFRTEYTSLNRQHLAPQLLCLPYKKHYREAEELWGEVLPVQRRVLGPEHQDTLVSMNALGWNYMEQHRYREAESLFREALPISRRVLGDKHGHTGDIIMNFAGLAALQGKRDAAFATLQQAIAVYGVGGPGRADSLAIDD